MLRQVGNQTHELISNRLVDSQLAEQPEEHVSIRKTKDSSNNGLSKRMFIILFDTPRGTKDKNAPPDTHRNHNTIDR